MKHRFLQSAILCGIGMLALASCAPKGGPASGDETAAAATAEHGKYLVKSIGCGDCHTPWTMGPQGPMQDTTRLLSGHPAGGMPIAAPAQVGPPWMGAIDFTFTAFSGPWGVSFTANLTPDSATGLGAWSQETFMQAIRTGKHMGTGRPILPPMPWPSFTNMTDKDLASGYLYLKTIPPISNKVPDPILNPMMGKGGPPLGAIPPPAVPPPGSTGPHPGIPPPAPGSPPPPPIPDPRRKK